MISLHETNEEPLPTPRRRSSLLIKLGTNRRLFFCFSPSVFRYYHLQSLDRSGWVRTAKWKKEKERKPPPKAQGEESEREAESYKQSHPWHTHLPPKNDDIVLSSKRSCRLNFVVYFT
ncbi:hypothetical protein M406DRAFT_103874 [Cryphonectria parasitica EP155]|uniref:Uncharacterized protein n=1 Tax=Cryphonectria parasitica (strain ATCC 38755 / EP155) TaxID=660469 RepID=A0A9P4XYY1_CRYP1|nr:uncharacterized protein M406DRAFT_103874 [Cryphonectria parasitica EP155]KAF3763573.1 hypothetical protein M406DRAFT_103874 [Cryphonectria parasitica EP155]